MPPLTEKKVKPINNSAVRNNLFHCNYLLYFDNFSILDRKNKKFSLEITESLPIMKDKPLLNRNISSAPLHLFDSVLFLVQFTVVYLILLVYLILNIIVSF